ncbi:LysM peptidoglycan-binding domain-containing protein [Lachnoclostridium phytofermentans]|uniref:Peptidoglycan-binding LysM n=1 Tax=Lachnoclostridium phytofermentans (strain ATCC 700394 / DSM 18823 / ISDg) TaxID=357809 RepID=A9KQD2_LACP7|nr:LysM peptidoglycan-binding domain-containing protein [Lachnoclostridium phytofermentans]ABX40441.1 Peptidoglycan-binding LysM [Lachnoclostridium phytofermentans ISDg]
MNDTKFGYKSNQTAATMEKTASKIKIPKNVRQIGKIGDQLKIYMEDYVKTYTRQLAESDYASRCMAVLVGEYRHEEDNRNVFIYGAILVENCFEDGKIVLKEDSWAMIYEKIKQYFSEAEIVGWYYGGTGFGTDEITSLREFHIDNFAGRDKVLLTYDVLEKEDNFYIYDGYDLKQQPGYYIYYEKNLEMQNYMVDHKKVKHEELEINDRAMKEIRTILKEKKQPLDSDKEQRNMLRLGYAAGGLMTVVALVVGITVMNNTDRMKQLEQQVSSISKDIFDKDTNKNKDTSKEVAAITPIHDQDLVDEPNVDVSKGDNVDSVETSGNKTTPMPTKGTDEVTITPTIIPTLEPTKSPTVTPTATQAPAETPIPTKGADQTTSNIDVTKLKTYQVKSGDTLAGICMRLYGNYNMQKTIKELNQLVDENVIFEGQELLVP